jgi:hypothetical protein
MKTCRVCGKESDREYTLCTSCYIAWIQSGVPTIALHQVCHACGDVLMDAIDIAVEEARVGVAIGAYHYDDEGDLCVGVGLCDACNRAMPIEPMTQEDMDWEPDVVHNYDGMGASNLDNGRCDTCAHWPLACHGLCMGWLPRIDEKCEDCTFRHKCAKQNKCVFEKEIPGRKLGFNVDDDSDEILTQSETNWEPDVVRGYDGIFNSNL